MSDEHQVYVREVTESPGRTGLHAKIDLLSSGEAAVASDFLDAMLMPIYSEQLPSTWLTTPAWSDSFVARLRAHHALSIAPLSTTQFEASFNEACLAAGWTVTAAASATHRFFDTTIATDSGAPLHLSLKASAAQGMRAGSVHISKLTEAAWIQDVRRQSDRRDNIVKLFREYQRSTSSIMMLRGFREREGYAVLYELLEIPTAVFGPVSRLSVEQAQASTIKIPAAPAKARFSIRVDRSDAKITVAGIDIDICIVHGRWGLGQADQAADT
jgi:hypothetical protein